MTCEECLALMDGDVESELEGLLSDSISAHLAACVGCARTYQEVRREREVYTHYFLAAEPTAALWANLQKSIEVEKAARSSSLPIRFRHSFVNAIGSLRHRPAHAAALALIFVGITLGALGYIASRQGVRPDDVTGQTGDGRHLRPLPSSTGADEALAAERRGKVEAQPGKNGRDRAALQGDQKGSRLGDALPEAAREYVSRANQKPDAFNTQPLPDDSVRKAEQQYLAAIAVLTRNVNRWRKQLDAGAIAQLNQALAEVDRTITDTRRAVREHPNDPLAVMYMTMAYEKKVEVLRQLIGS